MKFKVTQKEMKDQKPMIAVNYCGLQWLLEYKSPICYSSSNTYGWACDYYKVESTDGRTLWISTGYMPQGKQIDYATAKRYNEKARQIAHRYIAYSLEKQKTTTDLLLKKFVDEVLAND